MSLNKANIERRYYVNGNRRGGRCYKIQRNGTGCFKFVDYDGHNPDP